ncbi:Ankyrin repeat and protein kinase domain-containing protein 1 [Seminavis robusta]|uniref:Ankyrin repeat and protein kinase domain-containing protein 1 n=1 Tax=Seminavis robusta TaxID=568900 RepID=A0A9N8EZU2_9STRA|nr:Ankyrin repeat and protein kinase domain-containing protein 1 [Seminavis robusta]|eukprot:Sro2481_g328870.1 Ankyrin repeat and protein kinase domain-containing protein 1 (1309) ;mRNA; r:7040-11043
MATAPNGSANAEGNNHSPIRPRGSLLSSTNTKLSRSQWKRARKARREAKVVQKSASHVDKIVRELTEGLPFLLNTPNQPIAKFHRSEIVVGNLLGRGVFARVYEVKDFDLHDEDEEEEVSERLSPQQQIIQEMGGNGGVPPFDSSSSSHGSSNFPQNQQLINTVDDRPLGAIAESESDEEDDAWGARTRNQRQRRQQQQQRPRQQQPQNGGGGGSSTDSPNGDDSTTAGTSSTAPISAPPTPPLPPQALLEDEGSARTVRFGTNNRGSSSLVPHNSNSVRAARGSMPNRPSLRFSTSNYQRNFMSSNHLDLDQSTLRLKARDVVQSGEMGYALKHLTQTLLRNPKDFYLAAAALLVEAKYLSKLNHPNIIKVTGLAMSGAGIVEQETPKQQPKKSISSRFFDDASNDNDHGPKNGLESAQHDSYFLVSERLTDTLDRRIRQWKRDQPARKKLSELTSGQKIQAWKHMMRKTSYALQISNALAYLHERNLLYRDLKPPNIGFSGDNQTIVLFNFGLCRELNPATLKVREDPVTALFGALSWRYTAVECFPQPVVATPAQLVASSTRFLQNHSSRSFGLDSLSSSLHGRKGGRKYASSEDVSPQEVQRELLAVQEEYQEEIISASMHNNSAGSSRSRSNTPRPNLPEDISNNDKKKKKKKKVQDCVHMVKASYDVNVDVYSWAMVYYEMLTLNQPFSGMTQKEHLRKVAGPKGGQRPGVYQFDLTPSMISLLQRAWDQNPKKRPTMESVGRNLQLILRELEVLIKAEQKVLLKKAGGTEEAVAALTSREERAARRAKLIMEETERMVNSARSPLKRVGKNSSVLKAVIKQVDGLFAKNRYRRGDVRDSVMGPPATALLGTTPAPNVIPGLANPASTPGSRDSIATATDIDVDALEYEAWSSDGGDDGESLSMESEDPSSLTDNFGETAGNRDSAPAENAEFEIPVIVEEDENEEGSDADVVGDAISAFRNKKKETKSQQSLSGNTGERVPRSRRKTKSDSMKYKSRKNMLDNFSLERRGTNRMSRRTMRLSRASVWMMRRDVRIFVILFSIAVTAAFCGAGWSWYKRRQRTWLGVDLEYLGVHNKSNAREVLEGAIMDACRHEVVPEKDPNVPMIFQGGALSPVDLECTDKLQRQLDDKMARVTGVPVKKPNSAFVGFLNLQQFDRPPPQPKKRWRRKRVWKFFREPDSNKASSPPSYPSRVDYPATERKEESANALVSEHTRTEAEMSCDESCTEREEIADMFPSSLQTTWGTLFGQKRSAEQRSNGLGEDEDVHIMIPDTKGKNPPELTDLETAPVEEEAPSSVRLPV